jgi:hypothetical protein
MRSSRIIDAHLPDAQTFVLTGGGNPNAMSICDTCGNDYDKAFTVTFHDGRTATFDSVECAASQLAPQCLHCGCRILGHGIETDDGIFCCAHCARKDTNADVNDRWPVPAGA